MYCVSRINLLTGLKEKKMICNCNLKVVLVFETSN